MRRTPRGWCTAPRCSTRCTRRWRPGPPRQAQRARPRGHRDDDDPRRRAFEPAGVSPLLSAARHTGVRRADRARGTHATGPGGAARLDQRAGVQGGPRLRAARPRPARGTARDLPRLGAWPGARRDLGRDRVRGALVSHGARLSELYVRFGGLPWMQGLFYGIGAAVIAIIARSALKLVRMTLGRDHLLWMLFVVSAVVTAWTESEIIWVFLLCGLVPMLLRGRQTTPATPALALLPVAPGIAAGLAGPASVGILWKILTYFAGASLFVFGSGLAIVPFL